jgi:hypothetical protein
METAMDTPNEYEIRRFVFAVEDFAFQVATGYRYQQTRSWAFWRVRAR